MSRIEMAPLRRRALECLMLVCGSVTALQAQATPAELGARIAAVRDGVVRLEFPARAGVCGNGQNWYRNRDDGRDGRPDATRYVDSDCERGPVRVVIERSGGANSTLRTYVGGRWTAVDGAAAPLVVSAEVAVGALMAIVERDTSSAAQHAIAALSIADAALPWQRLMVVAKDEQRPSQVRQQAVFWLGDAAGEVATRSLETLAYEPGDRQVREQAIFAVSRRPGDEAVTSLLRMAETLPDRELRKTAIFWLSRSKDPRALAWLERTLGAK